ncbi:WD repeat and coiled-coil-containing protein [Hippocampus comes]|uniref:WD repeat and coiled-coil-containing protein n=1 Tax=Hippocampus comes TaxID=109280 RepID=A0A3Q2XGG3_HIPCM|nr:PREDICTED: WD repeat and coiled-coil-containing protein [Hippocampus comes]XP_019712065.1 PREDICTED: WD repeat and coiled-coil-containing protein [Hippocampus comes]XP_019712066.1 PREDICTED: WD repeat and coiled-coil-containing protein [Hippocampus comes]
MDLGKAKLLRSGINTLHQAIHPVHGVAWTDGKQVCLTTLYFQRGETKFGDTNVIGQFEHVLGLFWGPLCCPDSPALLAVQHKKHVSVWQLQLSALEHNKLLCTQTCEMSEPFPLLAQGCVWHPKLDILALLTKRDASVLFSVRVDNRRTKADIKGSGLIHCASWTKDGTRLVVAIGTALHSYIWNDIHKSLVACSFCPIFDVGGYICATEATGDSQVAVATELPLEKLCGLNAGMAFEVDPSRVQTPEIDFSQDSRRLSFDLAEKSHTPTSGPLDLTHLLARHRRSDPSPLIHLQRKDSVTGSGQDSSHLVLITYERKVVTTRKVSIPGILVPDLVAFDPRASTVAVASNTCNMVLVYRITASAMPNIQQISLQATDRPKGVCFLSDKVLLMMVGRQKSMDPAFLPSSNTEKYILRLVAKDFDGEGASSHLNVEPAANLSRIRRHSEHLPKDDREQLGIKDLILPGNGVVPRSPGSRCRLVEEVRSPESSSADFSASSERTPSCAVENLDVGRMASLAVAGQTSRDSSRAGSPRPEVVPEPMVAPPGGSSRERALEHLVFNMERLFARFADVQQCLGEIREYAQNGKKVASSYPAAAEPPYINVTCQKQLSENVFIDERRPMLLCDGKLCLRALQELFNLTVVEMLHGPLWIVLVADSDGFVPLTFNPRAELTVRNGKRKSTVRTPGSPEISCPSSPAPCHNPTSTTTTTTEAST